MIHVLCANSFLVFETKSVTPQKEMYYFFPLPPVLVCDLSHSTGKPLTPPSIMQLWNTLYDSALCTFQLSYTMYYIDIFSQQNKLIRFCDVALYRLASWFVNGFLIFCLILHVFYTWHFYFHSLHGHRLHSYYLKMKKKKKAPCHVLSLGY